MAQTPQTIPDTIRIGKTPLVPRVTKQNHNVSIPHIIPMDETSANLVLNPTTGKVLKYKEAINSGPDKAKWNTESENEFGRLSQGVADRIKGTDNFFVPYKKVPKHKKPTYVTIVVNIRPNKTEEYRVRITVGGNQIIYKYIVSTPTADNTTVKCMFNHVVSTLEAEFTILDIKNTIY